MQPAGPQEDQSLHLHALNLVGRTGFGTGKNNYGIFLRTVVKSGELENRYVSFAVRDYPLLGPYLNVVSPTALFAIPFRCGNQRTFRALPTEAKLTFSGFFLRINIRGRRWKTEKCGGSFVGIFLLHDISHILSFVANSHYSKIFVVYARNPLLIRASKTGFHFFLKPFENRSGITGRNHRFPVCT